MKTNKIFLILFIGIFLVSFASAVQEGIGKICIDVDAPTWPENSTLILISSGMNIQLSWTNATDIPECSGIDHYEIYRGFNEGNLTPVATTLNDFYSDTVQNYGTYFYMIHAFDKVNNNESNNAISNSITISKSSGGGTAGSGGGGSAITAFWECGEWSACSDDGIQTRTCEDLQGLYENKTESRTCIPAFIPERTESEEETPTQPTEETPKNFFTTMTGAVIGTLGKGGTALASVFTFLIIAGLIAMAVNKKRA